MQPLIRALLAAAALFCGSAVAADSPFLWEVKGPKATHYLMGSMHYLPDSVYPLAPAFDEAYSKADTVVFETDIAALSDPKTQKQMLVAGRAPAGLKALVGAGVYARLQDYLRAKALEPSVCDSVKAWYCVLTLEQLAFEQLGYRGEFGLDLHYFKRSRSVQKTILWLEEPSAQLKLFSDMPDADAQLFLQGTLDEGSSSGATPEQLMQTWRSGDAAALERIVADFRQQAPGLYERLNAARNRAWLPRLEKMFAEEGSHLVIVGAAHLVGADGLVNLLKARGYGVTPVATAPVPAPASALPASIPLAPE